VFIINKLVAKILGHI